MPKAASVNSTPRRPVSAIRTQLDPIFGAIKNHKRLDRVWLDLAEANGDRDVLFVRASEAAETAAWNMARTKPTTTAGVAALLAYNTTGPITGLFELGETAWHETAFRTAVGSLAEITGTANPA